MADKTYTVTVASGNLYGGGTGNVFYLDGVRNSTGPGEIKWVQGSTLRFNQNDSSNVNHPLLFTTDASSPNSYRITTGVTYNLDGSTVPESDYTTTASFNAATTRYVEITPANNTDFYYFCYVHGIGMGGPVDLVQDAWGALSWGEGGWQDQGSIAITPTGIGTTISLGSPTIDANVELGWSREAWGQQVWGDNENFVQVDLTGIGLTASLGSVTINAEVNTGWGRANWGDLSWGVSFSNQTVQPTGIGMTASIGTLSASTEVNTGWGRSTWGGLGWGIASTLIPTGFSMSFSLGTVTATTEINTGWGRKEWGQGLWNNDGDQLIVPTGFGMNVVQGNPSIQTEINTGWGRSTWGALDWGGFSDSIIVGVSGNPITVSLNSVTATPNTIVTPTGVSTTVNLGTLDVSGTADITPTGNSLTVATGSLNAIIWNQVDTGTAPTWKNVDTAA
jgi:hypothetical protein